MNKNGTKGILFLRFAKRKINKKMDTIAERNRAMANNSKFAQRPIPIPVIDNNIPSPRPIFPDVSKLISMTTKPIDNPPNRFIIVRLPLKQEHTITISAPNIIGQSNSFFLYISCIANSRSITAITTLSIISISYLPFTNRIIGDSETI